MVRINKSRHVSLIYESNKKKKKKQHSGSSCIGLIIFNIMKWMESKICNPQYNSWDLTTVDASEIGLLFTVLHSLKSLTAEITSLQEIVYQTKDFVRTMHAVSSVGCIVSE